MPRKKKKSLAVIRREDRERKRKLNCRTHESSNPCISMVTVKEFPQKTEDSFNQIDNQSTSKTQASPSKKIITHLMSDQLLKDFRSKELQPVKAHQQTTKDTKTEFMLKGTLKTTQSVTSNMFIQGIENQSEVQTNPLGKRKSDTIITDSAMIPQKKNESIDEKKLEVRIISHCKHKVRSGDKHDKHDHDDKHDKHRTCLYT
ncbi:unnamed protein product [Mytilus coruscus]|uniref:Uncharacterized protein n=1 Tax=Mytilus coruscus TaxID=42192 RepID=A0A6J8CKH9_MYTCO|nr:unnamed protein product [Mytilus coruscus]